MADVQSVKFTVESVDIDTATSEVVLKIGGPMRDKPVETRVPLSDVFAKAEDNPPGEKTIDAPMDTVDTTEAREWIAEREGVHPDDVLIMRVDAPCEINYDIRDN